MSNPVMIQIKSTQEVDGENDKMELVTAGNYYEKAGCYYISYQESEITGMDGVNTVIKVSPSASVIQLMRFGEGRSQLIFEKDKRHNCMYQTFAGMMMVSVSSHDLSIQLDECGGSVRVSYTIEINSSVTSHNSFLISVSKDQTARFKN